MSVVRAFVTVLHPDRVEGLDHRVPSAKRFNEWRRYLEPTCHYPAVTTIRIAVRTHLSNDANTKNHVQILMAVYRCELPDGRVVDVVRSAAAETFALTPPAQLCHCLFSAGPVHCLPVWRRRVRGQAHRRVGPLLKRGGGRARRPRQLRRLPDRQRRSRHGRSDEGSKRRRAGRGQAPRGGSRGCPGNMQHADDCWVKISPAQRAGAYEMYGIGCPGHSLNLSTKVSHKKSESTVISASMVYDRAARVMQRFYLGGYRRRHAGGGPEIPETLELKALELGHQGPMFWGRVHPKVRLILKGYVGKKPAPSAGECGAGGRAVRLVPAGKHLDGGELPAVGDVLWKVSKLLATDGEHDAYYPNEYRAFNIFAKMRLLSPCRLPSVKGSR